MKAYSRYAKLIMAQHLAKIQFIAEHTNCEACDISAAMTALLNAYEELNQLHTKLLVDEAISNDEVNKNVAEQDV